MSTQDLADRAGTSRPTVSAYEHGHKSPTLRTAQRLLEVAGHALDVTPLVRYAERTTRRGRPFTVPDRLARLPVEAALATVDVALHLEWSGGRRLVDLADRHQRARFYEVVLREGTEPDLRRYVDGALLVDLWDELTLADERERRDRAVDRCRGARVHRGAGATGARPAAGCAGGCGRGRGEHCPG